jgi:hypothetical protein
MPYAPSGAIHLFYDTAGHPSDSPVVLVAWLGRQMPGLGHAAIQDRADCGHHVIRSDNRDDGLSSGLDLADFPESPL